MDPLNLLVYHNFERLRPKLVLHKHLFQKVMRFINSLLQACRGEEEVDVFPALKKLYAPKWDFLSLKRI